MELPNTLPSENEDSKVHPPHFPPTPHHPEPPLSFGCSFRERRP